MAKRLPACVLAMGCACRNHAAGASPSAACDAREPRCAPSPSTAKPTEIVKLKDCYSGDHVWLSVRDGVVVGVMGSDPKRFMGLSFDVAKHHAARKRK